MIERIQSQLMEAALTYPLAFWTENKELLKIICVRNTPIFFINALRAIQLQNPDCHWLRLGLAHQIYSAIPKPDQIEHLPKIKSGLLQECVTQNYNWCDVDKASLKDFYQSPREPYPLARWSTEYAKAYYGTALIREAKDCFDDGNTDNGKETLQKFARYCLIGAQGDPHDELSFNEAVNRAIRYWVDHWRSGCKNESFYTSEVVDLLNIKTLINLLLEIAYKQKYTDRLTSAERENLLNHLEELSRPGWVKKILAIKEKDDEDSGKLDEAA